MHSFDKNKIFRLNYNDFAKKIKRAYYKKKYPFVFSEFQKPQKDIVYFKENLNYSSNSSVFCSVCVVSFTTAGLV
jgi:hypothetical protein